MGIEVGYTEDGVGVHNPKPALTPLPLHLKLSAYECPLFSDPELYKCLVGKLNFLTHTRPNLSFTMQTLSQFMHCLGEPLYQALQHVLRYIASTSSQGILLKGTPHLSLQAFSDSD